MRGSGGNEKREREESMLESHKGLNWRMVVSVEVEFWVKRCVAKLNEPSLNISLSLIFDSRFISYFFFLNTFLFPHQTSITQNTADVIFQKEEKKGKKEASVIPCVREMLRLSKVFDLREDVFPLIPHNELRTSNVTEGEGSEEEERSGAFVCVCVCV